MCVDGLGGGFIISIKYPKRHNDTLTLTEELSCIPLKLQSFINRWHLKAKIQ
jgi:hypothetical protein